MNSLATSSYWSNMESTRVEGLVVGEELRWVVPDAAPVPIWFPLPCLHQANLLFKEFFITVALEGLAEKYSTNINHPGIG